MSGTVTSRHECPVFDPQVSPFCVRSIPQSKTMQVRSTKETKLSMAVFDINAFTDEPCVMNHE